MLRLTQLKLPVDHGAAQLEQAILARLGIARADLLSFSVVRRGVDARRRQAISFVYSIDVALGDEASVLQRCAADRDVAVAPDCRYHFAAHATQPPRQRPVVIGCGPCGLFAALLLAQMGFRPLLLERGKSVRERSKDTFAFWRQGRLTPESNVQFGEGGAGTFSDGKLHTQIRDPQQRGLKVLDELVKAGAPEEIRYVAKPHIGTFRLVTVVENLRAAILSLGGEIRFQARVEDFDIAAGRLRGLVLQDGEHIAADHVVLAIGHSARDTFEVLHARGVVMEAKAFSIGVRIEHPQSLIDRARYGQRAGDPLLGAADYKLVHHCRNGRAVYSFCMCPGGTVVAAASEPGGVVTNGMSQYSRAERNANSGLVVGVTPADYPGDALAGVAFQRHWEALAFRAGGGTYAAPAQRVGDFLAGRASQVLGSVLPSYAPGVHLADLADCLPAYVVEALREALPAFAKTLPGFALPDAMLTGVETRTSSPLRIGRGSDMQSLNVRGLYPAGEGAGYAGGIMSAAVDGIEVAEALARHLSARSAAGA